VLKNGNIICISSIDWDFVWQGHQEIMASFARNGNKVLFIENTGVRVPGIKDASRIRHRLRNWLRGIKGIRKEMANLYVYSPVILPFPYSRIARLINRFLMMPVLKRWMKVMDFADPIIWTFLPTGLALDLLNNIDSKLTIYYCIADFEKLVKMPKKIRATEKKVIEKSDLVFAQCEKIKQHCEKFNPNVSIFPFGVNMDIFSQADVCEDNPDKKSTILGYVGGIHKHIDFKLVKYIAEYNKDWKLVFIGPLQTDISSVRGIKNIRFIEKQDHSQLMKHINTFSACLIPYLINDYTETVYPTKLNEYHAVGKPVVSTALPEVINFNRLYDNIAYVGGSEKEFLRQVEKAIREDSNDRKIKRREIASENSWQRRIEKMSGLIESEIENRKKNRESGWSESLIAFYRKARKRSIRLAGAALLIYLLVFKTSFMWFFASPLKISEIPQKVDAIVVFGGGVGETGHPGISTVERAHYAAELYKDGFARKVIFSSGYTYFYNDAENMKQFAISMGVPQTNIILEQKANNTYENVVFSNDLLRKNDLKSALLVSAPYNTLRASLVFKKNFKDLEVIYTPVINSHNG